MFWIICGHVQTKHIHPDTRTHSYIYIYITHMAIFIRAYERILILGRCIYIYPYIYIHVYIYMCVCKIKNERIYLLIDTYVL